MYRLPTRRTIATLLALAATLAGVPVALASSGGVGPGAAGGGGGGSAVTPVTPGCPDAQLGQRTLRLGDCGGDVETLNWILKAKDYGNPALVSEFEPATKVAVQAFQRAAGLSARGVVDTGTSAALVNAMPPQRATWYGPGFFGNQTACGQKLTRSTIGVAHRTLPCGSQVVIAFGGRFVRTTVIDRGPYANGAKWDLTQATADALRFMSVGVGDVRVAKLPAA